MKHFKELVESKILSTISEAEDEIEVTSDDEGAIQPDEDMTDDGELSSEEPEADDGDQAADDDAKIALMADLKKAVDNLDEFIVDEGIDDVVYEKINDLSRSLLNETSEVLGVPIPEDEDEETEEPEDESGEIEEPEAEETSDDEVSIDDIEFD